MAGDGSRFNFQFKPFIYATEKRFIELAKEPFNILKDKYEVHFIFTFRADHESQYNVKNTLQEIFPHDNIQFCILEDKTQGPLDTLKQTIQQLNLSGECFVCDCDHSINIEPMFNILNSNSIYDIIIPVWTITQEEYKDCGKIIIDNNNDTIIRFCEKEFVPFSTNYTVKGLLGCYYFKDISCISSSKSNENISDFLIEMKEQLIYKISYIYEAYFFGDFHRLETFRSNRAKQHTIFLDLDGTIFKQYPNCGYNIHNIEILPGSIEKIQEWKRDGHTIIITTGRSKDKYDILYKTLQEIGIPFDKLLIGLPAGPRYVINDKKPYNPFIQMARGIQLQRDGGISNIDIPKQIKIIDTLHGASFAKLFIIEKDSQTIVRKYIYKTKEHWIHYETLKRQYEDLQRFNFYSPGIVPKIISQEETHDEYFFDLEYLNEYKNLALYSKDTQIKVLELVVAKLKKDIYCYSKPINGNEWLEQYLNEKIFAKFNLISKYNTTLFNCIYNEFVTINGKRYTGINKLLTTMHFNKYTPSSVSPVHGDLTLGNILYNQGTSDFKLIDMAGSKYVDIYELDFAKVLQSLLSKYDLWKDMDTLVTFVDESEFVISNDLLHFNEEDYTNISNIFGCSFKKGVFHLGLFWIRMMPFMIHEKKDYANLGILLCTIYLNHTLI
jgi:hypothetical protein